MNNQFITKVQFSFSKKATKFLKKSPSIFDVYLLNFKSTGRFCQIFVALLEKLNFNRARFSFHSIAKRLYDSARKKNLKSKKIYF